jgi:hypothetical protein
MIIQENKSTLKQSHPFQSVSFGIKREGLAHIFNVLRNQLYSDKILAVVREYSCNALDSHVESGQKDRPIVVTLPNPLNLAFKVRDFGFGLSEQQVRDIYANYGESTKRGTNELIGQLGLGSKSAFAYGENFLIRSFQNGVVSLYNAFIDPSQIGQIAKLHSEPTNEENGIEIEIPINKNDIDTFKSKAEGLFKYFKTQPSVNGNAEYNPKRDNVAFAGSCFRFVETQDSNSFARGRSVTTVALMGNIPYPISRGAINWDNEPELGEILNRNIVIDFDIGDLEVSASREALQYTPHTQKNIIAKLRAIKEECLAEVNSKLTNGKSMYEAKIIYNSIFNFYTGSLCFLSSILKPNDLKFNGKDISSGHWNIESKKDNDNSTKITCFKIKRAKRYNDKAKVRGENVTFCLAERDCAYVIKDVKIKILNRIAPLCEMSNNHLGRKFNNVYLIEPGSDFNAWVNDNQFDAPTIKLSELPAVSFKDLGYATKSADGNQTVNEKHNVEVFSVNYNEQYSLVKSDFFTPIEVDMNLGGVWFEIDRFVPTCGHYDTYTFIKTLKDACKFLGLDETKVVAVKVSNSEEFKKNKNWQTVSDYIKANAEKYLADNNVEQKFADRKEFLRILSLHGDYFYHTTAIYKLIDNKNSEMKICGEHAHQMMFENFGDTQEKISQICAWANVEIKMVKPTFNLESEWGSVKSKYPMYMMIDDSKLTYKNDKSVNNNIVNYINMIDATTTK